MTIDSRRSHCTWAFRSRGATPSRFSCWSFIFTILVPDADGPSPWDPSAFRKGMMEMIANFRILDELADLGIVKVADVGEGWLIVDLDPIGVSNRTFGCGASPGAPLRRRLCLLSRACACDCLPGARAFPRPVTPGSSPHSSTAVGSTCSSRSGRANSGTIRTLTDSGAPRPTAAAARVLQPRVRDSGDSPRSLVGGFIYLGWGGAVGAFLWTVVLVAGVVSLTRPLGRAARHRPRLIRFAHLDSASTARDRWRRLACCCDTPGLLRRGSRCCRLWHSDSRSLAFWSIKQAFSVTDSMTMS